MIIIILLQDCVSFYFWSPADVPLHAGVRRFLQPSCHLSRSCAFNLCKPLAVMSHSCTSLHLGFLVFLFLSHQLLSVLPLLDPFLHSFSPHAPTIAIFALSETLPVSLHSSFQESSHCLLYLSKFFHVSFATLAFL